MTAGDGRWHPGIGDPDATGWITVAAYLAAGVLSALCAVQVARVERARDPGGRNGVGRDRSRGFWTALAVLMLMLGLNKQLDLQTWFTEIGRDVAMAQGWYERRFKVQVEFIAGLAVVGAIGMVWLQWRLRRLDRFARGAASGLLLLTVFVVIRAASFHHVDQLLGVRLAGLRINVILELGGIACIALAAGLKLRSGAAAGPAPAASDQGQTSMRRVTPRMVSSLNQKK